MQDTLNTELLKEGLKIGEAELSKLLQKRTRLIKDLYSKPITEAGFNRAKSEEEMVRTVANYSISVNDLIEALENEAQELRMKLAAANQLTEEMTLAYATQSKLSDKLLNLLEVKL